MESCALYAVGAAGDALCAAVDALCAEVLDVVLYVLEVLKAYAVCCSVYWKL